MAMVMIVNVYTWEDIHISKAGAPGQLFPKTSYIWYAKLICSLPVVAQQNIINLKTTISYFLIILQIE